MTYIPSRTGRHATLSLLLATTALVALGVSSTRAQSLGNGSGTGVIGAPVAPTAPNAGPATADSTAVGEVIVTSQRRAENLQDVPISVEAITGAAVRNADITEATRLEEVVPGLRVGRSGTATRPAIRGVYTEAIGINSDPRVGFYVDEIYQSRPQQGDAAFTDLERVEVQKGPQGTLYGRNSLGGNIAITSAVPKDHFEAGVDGTYGNYSRFKTEGYINIPIMDGLDARIAGFYDRHDGYLKSSITPAADLEDKNNAYVRGSLRWAPPALGGKLEVLLRGSYFSERDHGYNSFNSKLIGALVDASLITKPGGTITFNGVNYPAPLGYNGGNYATGVAYPFSTAFRDGIPDVEGADIGIPIPGKYQTIYDYPARQRTAQQAYSSQINYDVTSWLRLRSITGYTKFSTTTDNDGDGGPINYYHYFSVTKAETFTQELQFQSTDKTSPFQYTVGGFFMYDDDRDGAVSEYSHNYTTATAASLGEPALLGGGGACGYTYLPNPVTCQLSNLNAADSAGPEHATTQSYAAYAQGSYTTFQDRLTFTLGARYTVDRKTFKNVAQTSDFVGTYVQAQNKAYIAANPGAAQSALPFPNAASLTAPYAAGAGYHAEFPSTDAAAILNETCGGVIGAPLAPSGSNAVVGTVPDYYQTRCGQRSFKFATYRAAVDFKLTDTNLLYASFSTGRHSGGFGASYAPTTSPNGIFATFNSEGVRAYEVGSKNRFFDGRVQLNADAFYNEYTHVQIQGLQNVPTGGGNSTNITTIYNGPSEIVPGFDVELIAKPWRALTVNMAIDYQHARYGIYGNPIYYSGLCTITQAAGSPCLGFAGPTYVASMGGLGSGFFPNPDTNPNLFVPASYAADGKTVTSYSSLIYGKKTEVQNTPDWSLHFGASYDFDLGKYGRLTPEFVTLYSSSYLLSNSLPNFRQTPYFKTDARVTWLAPNGRLTVQGFVENLEDVATIDRVTTSGLAVSGTYSDPRTYGIKVGYRY